MLLHVQDAKYLHDYVVWVRFNDGAEGEIDLEPELEGEVFGPLKDLELFRRFRVDPELATLVWENGADLAPEFLHDTLENRLDLEAYYEAKRESAERGEKPIPYEEFRKELGL